MISMRFDTDESLVGVVQVRRKLTASGVALGDDVLTLALEPDVDQLLIMGLVIVCGLINHSL